VIGRRGLAAGLGMGAFTGPARAAVAAEAAVTAEVPGRRDWPALDAALARLGADTPGRLGVSVLDTGTGRAAGLRATERFPMCSTFKALAAAAVLARVNAGAEHLDRRIPFTRADLVPYSPVTGPAADGPGLTLAELCDAMVTLSDNTAANLALRAIGGPEGLTAWLRGTGDAVTRLDRWEPALNTAIPGDPRDTTTPEAMLGSLHRLALGEVLSGPSRALLTGWLLGCRTGDATLRARLPAGWRVGDKTGSGAYNTGNDVGLLWPPGGSSGRPPILVTAFLTEGPAEGAVRSAVLAELGAAVAATA
jgi:beta-lactamase class A